MPQSNPCYWLLSICLMALALPALADPTNGDLMPGTSISGAYGSRSVFSNPAALGYQTELNGAQLGASFTYGVNVNQPNSTAFGLSYGYFGIGYQDLTAPDANTYQQYMLGLGVPLTSSLFLGARYVFDRTRSPALPNFDSVDLGLQYRLIPQWSLGFMTTGLNQPVLNGSHAPIQFILGTTVKPVEWLGFGADVDTLSDNFGKQYGYQGTVSVEPVKGLTLLVGYHDVYKWQVGFQFNLGAASLFSVAQPGSQPREVVTGLEISSSPFPSVIPTNKAVKITLDSSLGEGGVSGGWFGKDSPSLLSVLQLLERAREDHGVALVVMKIHSFPLGLAAAQELFEELKKVRKAGKRIEVFIGNASVRELLIASAANTIHMEPSAELTILGPKFERYFVKGTLDKLGIDAEFMARGEYKSAPEMFTRKDTSPINREADLAMLKEAEGIYLQALEKTRGLTDVQARTLQETAVFSATDAVQAHLVDVVDSYPEQMEKIREHYVVEDDLSYQRETLALPPKVSVITAEGDILQKDIRALALSGHSTITPARMRDDFDRALTDPRTKAIVLRVDSPGGEVLASQEIADMVSMAKKQKPVVVSMGDVAASGGYMISAPADRIFADPLTITGSIGVFLGKFNLGGLYDKIGLKKEILTTAPFADLMSEDRPWSEEERRIMMRELNNYYEGFVDYVAKQRSIPPHEAEASAKGRVWLGTEALKRKLSDESGGVLAAVHAAAEAAGLGEGTYEVDEIQSEEGIVQAISGDVLGKVATSPLADLTLGILSDEAIRELVWMASIGQNPFLYVAPVSALR